MRLALLATASALVLLNATPARADIGPGDLKQVIEDAWNDALDSLCAWLLEPAENLPELTLPAPPPEPMIGGYPTDLPSAAPDRGVAAAAESIKDQKARVASAEAAIDAATRASAAQAVQLQTLDALNKAAAVSVVSQIAVGNEINAVGVQAATTQAQMQASSLALQANEIMQREHAREIAIEQHKAWLGDMSRIRGGVRIQAD